MIHYDFFTLDNGLRVYVHQDKSSPIAVLNILYDVGSRDEDESKTGFAHLFEHLMFGGSKNIPSFDEPLQKVGGENNAFTSTDITNYYITLPSANLETAFWLESDRMLSLSFDPKVLEIQRSVVIEEFKQRYLNQPYGDAWLHLRPLAYKEHPYKWATIGKDISHIENATMDDVRDFFYKYYIPNNAIMVVAGDVETENIKKLSQKWFDPIPAGKLHKRKLPAEPEQNESRFMTLSADVPLDAIFKVYHMGGKLSEDYHSVDLMSDILGRGKSSRLYESLVKEKKIFNSINAHVMSSNDPGLLILEGKLNQGITMGQAENEMQAVIDQIREKEISANELQKVKNQAESSLVFSEVELLNRAMNLAFSANLGDAELINKEAGLIQAVQPTDIQKAANKILRKENSSTLFYEAKKA